MKYHYVVFSYPRDYFRVMFQEAIEKLNIEYITDPIAYGKYGKFTEFLYHLHINKYLNWAFEIPFKQLWYKYYYRGEEKKNICFVFLMDWVKPQKRGIVDALKVRYPTARFVLYLEDLVSSHSFDIEEAKKFDLVITYDKGDAERYGYEFMPTFLSKIEIKENNVPNSNCSFVGLAKNRVELINTLYKKLIDAGLKCDFIVSGLKDKTKQIDGIKYIKRDISYMEYLKHVDRTECIVELMQKEATGYTLRTWEALLYGKKLLTNNLSLKNASFYNPKQFIVFDDINEVDLGVLSESNNDFEYDDSDTSPIRFFEMIDNILR